MYLVNVRCINIILIFITLTSKHNIDIYNSDIDDTIREQIHHSDGVWPIYVKIYQGRTVDPLESGRSLLQSLFL